MNDRKDAPWGTVETRFDPIHSAARNRDVDTVRNQLKSGVDVDILNGRASNGDGGNTALWFAAQGPEPGGIKLVRVLVEAGARINRQCEHGRTALHMAAAWGHLDVVMFLVENGADGVLHDDEGMTPAMLARSSNRVSGDQLKKIVAYLDANKA